MLIFKAAFHVLPALTMQRVQLQKYCRVLGTFLRHTRIHCMEQENTIITAILAGADEYEKLIRRYHIGLIIHCEHLVGDRDDAEDIAQEAFIKAYSQLAHFKPHKARFSTWLYKIATNLAIDFLRKHKRRVRVDDIEVIAEVTMPYTSRAIHGSSIEIAKGADTRKVLVGKDSAYLINGTYAKVSQFTVGDSVAYVSGANNASARAIIKLSLESKYYSSIMQAVAAVNQPCRGNVGLYCSNGPQIGIYPYGAEAARSSVAPAGSVSKELQGQLLSYTNATLSLKAADGKTYTLSTPEGILQSFNAKGTADTSTAGVAPGDTLLVYYWQPAGTNGEVTSASQIQRVSLLLSQASKTGLNVKY